MTAVPETRRAPDRGVGDENADVAAPLDSLLVDEDDPHVNALGVKGVGEIGVTGTVGAIANAIWHATGIRPRRFPIHIEDLLA